MNLRYWLATAAVLLTSVTACFASRLLTNEQALAAMFPDADEVNQETRAISDAQKAELKRLLGGQLVHYTEAGDANKDPKDVLFYVAVKGGKKTGVGIIDVEPGKWGPVEFFIAMDPDTDKVQNIAVMAYEETRGRGIARRNFLEQFVGKAMGDNLAVHGGVDAVSGATVSSECAAFAVQKALALYNVVFAPKAPAS